MSIPVASEIEAAWHSLPEEARNRVGLIAIDMVFQAFVSGDAFGPKDQLVPGQSKRAQQMRGEASDAPCRRLTELHNVVEARATGAVRLGRAEPGLGDSDGGETMTALLFLPLPCSAAVAAMSFLGVRPIIAACALPVVIAGCWGLS